MGGMSGPLRSGQLADAAGVNVQTLRYYERRGLLQTPERTLGGHRLYPVESLTLLRVIVGPRSVSGSLSMRSPNSSTSAATDTDALLTPAYRHAPCRSSPRSRPESATCKRSPRRCEQPLRPAVMISLCALPAIAARYRSRILTLGAPDERL